MTAVSVKAAGVDNIVKEHLIYSHPAIIVHLRILFNIMSVHGFDHVTGALIELHWLPVRYRITNCVPSCMEWYMVTLRSTYLT